MKGRVVLTHRFVEYIPDTLEEGVLYVSLDFATVVHSCCCGCGNEVVTPLSPIAWKLIFDGETISLKPSIGNWSFACQSHYWITRNKVEWAAKWSSDKIAGGRARDARKRKEYFDRGGDLTISDAPVTFDDVEAAKPQVGFWQKLKQKLQRWLF